MHVLLVPQVLGTCLAIQLGHTLMILEEFHRLTPVGEVVVDRTSATCSTNCCSCVTMQVRWHLGVVEIQLLLDPSFLNSFTWLIISSTTGVSIHRQRRSNRTNRSNWINTTIQIRCPSWWNNVFSIWFQWQPNKSLFGLACPFNVPLDEIYRLVFLWHVWFINIWCCNWVSLAIDSISSIHNIIHSSLIWCWSLLWTCILVDICQLCNRCRN